MTNSYTFEKQPTLITKSDTFDNKISTLVHAKTHSTSVHLILVQFELVIKKQEVLYDIMNDIKKLVTGPQSRLHQTTFQTIFYILIHLITKL